MNQNLIPRKIKQGPINLTFSLSTT